MKSTMNRYQRNYMMAKAQLEVLQEEEAKIEQAYITAHSIVNVGGEVPKHVWCIDDEATFDEANEATAPAIEAIGLCKAEQAFKAAEDALINYGLSIMPGAYAKERETLRNACFGLNGYTYQLKIRKQTIDLSMRLDTRTVRA